MGGDSAGVAGYDLTVVKHPKVFLNGSYLMGYTSSFRMGQLLEYLFKPPEPDSSVPLMRFLTTTFTDAIRTCLKDGGFAKKENESETGGCFLVGIQGRLFRFEDGYHAIESLEGFDAIGCGAMAAMGSLHCTKKMPPQKRIIKALAIAEKCSAGVKSPFHLLTAMDGQKQG